MIRCGRVRSVLVGAVESLSLAQFSAFYALDYIAGSKGEEVSCPFDLRRNGAVLSEGAAALLIEDEAFARKRKANIHGFLAGQGSYFDAYRMNKYDPRATGIQQSMRRALRDANISERHIDYISASANSVVQHDALETQAIKEVFGKNTVKKPVSAIKSMIGESFSAGGLMQVVAGVASLARDFIPPTINYHVTDKNCDLDYVANRARTTKVNRILVNNFGPGGSSASLVLSRYN
jgi:3-oxoacyl-[acyl-carrier-protein] synthase II